MSWNSDTHNFLLVPTQLEKTVNKTTSSNKVDMNKLLVAKDQGKISTNELSDVLR